MGVSEGLKGKLKRLVAAAFHGLGYEFRKTPIADFVDSVPELSKSDRLLIRAAEAYSMTSQPRLVANFKACEYVIANNVAGDYVECGVWKGGNGILAKQIFEKSGAVDRKVWLFDTFAGMTSPTNEDRETFTGQPAQIQFTDSIRDGYVDWCYASLAEVKENFASEGLSLDGVRFVQGDVCVTLREGANIPNSISVLRLDTDWYESTLVELEVLYDRVSIGGVVILDDFGYWDGARSAVEGFLESRGLKPLINVIDDTGRLFIKTV